MVFIQESGDWNKYLKKNIFIKLRQSSQNVFIQAENSTSLYFLAYDGSTYPQGY